MYRQTSRVYPGTAQEEGQHNMKYIKAKDVQVGSTIELAQHRIQVIKAECLIGSEDLTITAESGQPHQLKTWQDVLVCDEQKG
jgi:hypothetical protein